MARPDDAYSDLAPICDQDALEWRSRHRVSTFARPDEDEWLVKLHQSPVFHRDLDDFAVDTRPDGVEQLHYLDQAYRVVRAHALTCLDERLFAGSRRSVEHAQHGRSNDNHSLG